MNLSELLAGCRREVQASAGPAPASEQPARDPLALARWRLYAAMEESLRLHADDQAAIEVSAYVVVPFLPRQSVARAALAWAQRRRLPTAPLERPLQAHRRAVREHLAHVDALRSELEAEGMPTGLLDGEEVVRLLWARFNPTKADKGRRAPSSAVELLGELDAPSDRDARPPGGDPAEGADRAVEPGLQRARTSTWSSTTTSSRRSSSRTRRAGRRWGGCTGRC